MVCPGRGCPLRQGTRGNDQPPTGTNAAGDHGARGNAGQNWDAGERTGKRSGEHAGERTGKHSGEHSGEHTGKHSGNCAG